MPGIAHETRYSPYTANTPARMRADTVTDYTTFISMEGAWNRPVDECEIDHPFLTFDWIRSWWEAFGRGKRLHIVVVREGSEIIAIAPLMITGCWFYGFRLRSLEFSA